MTRCIVELDVKFSEPLYSRTTECESWCKFVLILSFPSHLFMARWPICFLSLKPRSIPGTNS
uniref:Uncharacterized protein n=1 Tax=Rhizophora mucronata TaxID=61149 RepID=A0A2P2J7A2_RHIMU